MKNGCVPSEHSLFLFGFVTTSVAGGAGGTAILAPGASDALLAAALGVDDVRHSTAHHQYDGGYDNEIDHIIFLPSWCCFLE